MDTSLPKLKIIMRLPAEVRAGLPRASLPAGYSFCAYTSGDEDSWARIEAAVGEFPAHAAAREYFEKVFLAHPELARSSVVFVRDGAGTPVATASAWHAYLPGGEEVACLHWVATHPSAQGRGLGRAVSLRALSLVPAGRDVYLSTQTWSHRAVRMYHQFGFRLQRATVLTYDSLLRGEVVRRPSGNDYAAAMNTLADVLDGETLRGLLAAAEDGAPSA